VCGANLSKLCIFVEWKEISIWSRLLSTKLWDWKFKKDRI